MNGFQRTIRGRETYLLLGIGLLALLVQLVFSFVVFPHLAEPLGLGTDPDLFGQLAQNWANGQGYTLYRGQNLQPTTYRGPGYPLLLAVLYVAFGNLFPVAVLAQCLIGALLCLVIYYVGREIFGAWVGYVAALLGAFHPLLIWYSPRLRYEPLLTLLLALAILWWLRLQDSRSLRDAALMGLFFGFAALVLQSVILLPLVLFAGSVLLRAHKSIAAKPFAVALLTMATVIAPWTFRNYQVSGQIIPVHHGSVMQFLKGNYEFEHYDEAALQCAKLDEMSYVYVAQLLGCSVSELDRSRWEVEQALLPHALSFLRNEPGKLLAKVIAQIPRFWYLSESPLKSWFLAVVQGALLVPALIGAFGVCRVSRHGLPLILTVVYYNVVCAAMNVVARYSTLVVPYVVVLAAAGLRTILGAVREWRVQ